MNCCAPPRPTERERFCRCYSYNAAGGPRGAGAADLLGFRDGDPTSLANSYTSRTFRSGCQAQLRERIDAVAQQLAEAATGGHVIDYREREQRWSAPTVIQPQSWQAVCCAAGIRSGQSARRRELASLYVWALVTGGDPGRQSDHHSPRDAVTRAAHITASAGRSATRRGGVGEDYTVFRQRILPKCEPQLRALAAQLVAPEALTP